MQREASSRQRQWLCKRSTLLGLPPKGTPVCTSAHTRSIRVRTRSRGPPRLFQSANVMVIPFFTRSMMAECQSLCDDHPTLNRSTDPQILDTAECCIALILDAMSPLRSYMTWHGTIQNHRAIFLLLSLQGTCFAKILPVSMNSCLRSREHDDESHTPQIVHAERSTRAVSMSLVLTS